MELQIKSWHRYNQASCKLAQIPGIGPLSATALVASIGDAKTFKNGRQLAAWVRSRENSDNNDDSRDDPRDRKSVV